MTAFKLTYLLKAPSPDRVTPGSRALTYEFGGNAVQSTASSMQENTTGTGKGVEMTVVAISALQIRGSSKSCYWSRGLADGRKAAR